MQGHRGRGGLVLKADVPFSCCDPAVIRPCVHTAMKDRNRHEKLPSGKHNVIQARLFDGRSQTLRPRWFLGLLRTGHASRFNHPNTGRL